MLLTVVLALGTALAVTGCSNGLSGETYAGAAGNIEFSGEHVTWNMGYSRGVRGTYEASAHEVVVTFPTGETFVFARSGDTLTAAGMVLTRK